LDSIYQDAPQEWHVDPDDRMLYFFPNQTMPPAPPTPAPPTPAPPPAPGPIPNTFDIRNTEVSPSKQELGCSLAGATTPCCLDLQFYSTADKAKFAADNCHPASKGINQAFRLDTTKKHLQIANDGFSKCLTATVAATGTLTTAAIGAVTCASSGSTVLSSGGTIYQSWELNADGTLGVIVGGDGASFCLTGTLKDGGALTLASCDKNDPHQKWSKHDNSHDNSHDSSHDSSHSMGAHEAVSPPALTEAVFLDTVVSFKGTVQSPVKYVSIEGVRITHAATTQLQQYEIPSGGDWAVGRYGAVTVEGAVGVGVSNCFFDSVGGNGVLLSNYAKNSTISGNRISFPGESGVVSLGSSNMIDGTGDSFPSLNTISGNWIHDIGIFGKEVSCYFQSVSGRNTIKDNVCYNGPRAGIK
jgi:hypothetical protein